jgi:hypothetical protein
MRKKADIRTSDVEGPKGSTVDLSSGIEQIERPDLITVTDDTMQSPHVKEYARDLAFMEDILTIMVGESTDPNADNPVLCSVNGEKRSLMRGVEYKLHRKFVDSLIKREDRIKTVNFRDPENVDQTRVDKIPALRYPLSIISDPAGEVGRRWFQHQCKNSW